MLRFFTWANRSIEYAFYGLFFLVPLIIVNDTFELFEFNKMWVAFGLTLVIVSFWIGKMILARRILFQRTPLDIPILLFLLSQIISTIISMDPHVSFWGYYSRFNGGLLSTITYIILYYAFLSNFALYSATEQKELSGPTALQIMYRCVYVSLGTALLVALWGFPSRFGYDPTCLMFRGTLDVACWTEAFRPTIRMFSTLGQPDWLAAYFAIILPIMIGLTPSFFPQFVTDKKLSLTTGKKILLGCYVLLALLFFADFSWTDSRGGYLGFWAAFGLFGVAILVWYRTLWKRMSILLALFLIPFLFFFFFVSQPFGQLDPFTLHGISRRVATITESRTPSVAPQQKASPPAVQGPRTVITDSIKIRSIVWQGALDAWKHNWLIGTGVETFAFAYYKYRPVAHNLTSEWDYLYNKAHNEYLNYLTTTGLLGLGTHVAMIVVFLVLVARELYRQRKTLTPNTIFLVFAFLAAYIGIIATNFAGFSVVIVNVYFYLIPAFVLLLLHRVHPKSSTKPLVAASLFQWMAVCVVFFFCLYYIATLYRYWQADRAYALGYNRDRANQYDLAYTDLRRAIELRGDEPVFKDELAINNAVLAGAYAYQKDADTANKLAQQALVISNQVVEEYPNNVVFWKTRVRILYLLSQIDPKYLPETLTAIQKAHALAPTDAKIAYNLGLVYGQNGQKEKAVEALEQTVKMKPDYREAWYALGLYQRELAVNAQGKIINQTMAENAKKSMHYILDNILPNDQDAINQLKSWGE